MRLRPYGGRAKLSLRDSGNAPSPGRTLANAGFARKQRDSGSGRPRTEPIRFCDVHVASKKGGVDTPGKDRQWLVSVWELAMGSQSTVGRRLLLGGGCKPSEGHGTAILGHV